MTITSASRVFRRRLVAGLIEQARHPLRVVDVHLTAERFDEVFLHSAFSTDFRFRLSPSPFAPVARPARRRAKSRAVDRAASVTCAPPIILAISSTRRIIVQPRDAGHGSRAPDALVDVEVRRGARGDLRQVRNAKHLELPAEFAKLRPRRHPPLARRCRRRPRRRSAFVPAPPSGETYQVRRSATSERPSSSAPA